MTLKRYDLMVPEDFIFGQEIGVTLAAQYDKGLEQGVRHFSAETKKELLTVKEILNEISKNRCIAVWSKEFGENEIGLTVYSEDGKPQGTKLPLPSESEMYKILFGEKGE